MTETWLPVVGWEKTLVIKVAIGGRWICGACLRWRYSPLHGMARLLDMCPGDRRASAREAAAGKEAPK